MKHHPHHPHHPHRARRSAFTLIELIVAIGLTAILLFLVSRVFFETQRVLTLGIKTSNALAHARAIGTQLKTDADAMLGPGTASPRGFLVILNGTTIANVKQPDGTERPERVRTDQVVFIRSGGGDMTSLTPRDDTTLASDFTSSNAKIWYGHARRAETDGTAGGGFGTKLDTFANDWVLARHALLLAPTDSAGDDVATAGAIYLDHTGTTTATLRNQPTTGPTEYPAGGAEAGLSDMTNIRIGPDTGSTPPQTTDDIFVGANAGAGALLYLDQAFAEETLRVQTRIDTTVAGFQSWQSAQTHSYLAAHVSDFIVEFAGDYNTSSGNSGIDTIDDNGTPNDPTDDDNGGTDNDPIFWYSAETIDKLPPAAVSALTIRLTSDFVTVDPTSIFDSFEYADDSSAGVRGAYTFRIGNPDAWPSLIRIRYRIHDSQGRLGSIDNSRTADGIDNDLDGTTDEDDEANISGRMFEHIITVNRGS
ncbi:MAG: prepilin-type N-terminal cleavage/methylation domain-containing protein [Planctomycetota bacterium]